VSAVTTPLYCPGRFGVLKAQPNFNSALLKEGWEFVVQWIWVCPVFFLPFIAPLIWFLYLMCFRYHCSECFPLDRWSSEYLMPAGIFRVVGMNCFMNIVFQIFWIWLLIIKQKIINYYWLLSQSLVHGSLCTFLRFIVVEHTCFCGANVNFFGIHGLSCRRSGGCIPQHAAVNEMPWFSIWWCDLGLYTC